ncbi:MAG: hypothetical protein HC942_26445 [Microcoleus sp. SU_5_6]|nr:hypothetical protein [Microcoleus sp. SU_5_6]
MLDLRSICRSIPLGAIAIGDRTGHCCGELTSFLFPEACFLTLDICNTYCRAGILPTCEWLATAKSIQQFAFPNAVKPKIPTRSLEIDRSGGLQICRQQ